MARWVQNDWSDLIHRFAEAIKQLPEARRQALHEAGKVVLAEVRSQIDEQGINDSRGRVKRWQDLQMGSRGGFVRVAPVVRETTKWGYTSVDITRYLEHGHELAIPDHHGKSKYWESEKAVVSESTGRYIVPGRLFYSFAQLRSHKEALKAAERVLSAVTDELER